MQEAFTGKNLMMKDGDWSKMIKSMTAEVISHSPITKKKIGNQNQFHQCVIAVMIMVVLIVMVITHQRNGSSN